MAVQRLFIILSFILMGIVSRIVPHPPNMTAINSIALLSIFYLKDRWLSFFTVTSTLLLSDLIFGFHSTMPFVYFSMGLVVLLGCKLESYPIQRVPLFSIASSLIFFVITNFGVWLATELYPKNLFGLELCYVAALPFLKNQILGDLAYNSLFLMVFYLVSLRQKNPQEATNTKLKSRH